MSELIAEARVLVTPDTTAFRSLLITQLAAATKGVVVPVAVTPVVTGGSTTAAIAGTEGLAASQVELTTAITALTTALVAEQKALQTVVAEQLAGTEASKIASTQAREENRIRRESVAAAAAQQRALAQTARGAGATALSFGGLRGATLAATGPFLAGAAALTVLAKSLQSFSSFQTTLNVFQATAGATAGQLADVSAAAKQLGQDVTLPAVNAADAAEAMTELAKAGLSVQDSIDGARGVLQLATAAAISNADATQIAASALNAFGLAGDQAVHVADVLANSANQSQGEITDVGLALQQTAAVARQVGLSLEDTVTILTELQRAGIRGSDAGTSLKVSLIKLIAPSKQAAEVLRQLNVHVLDAQGNLRPEVFTDFAKAQEGLSQKQQNANAAIVFGTDGLRTYAVAAREGVAGAQQIRAELDKQGTAAGLAAARTKGLAGELENAKNQAAQFGLTLGKVFSGPAAGFLAGAAHFFESLNTVSDQIGRFVKPKDFDATTGSLDTMISRVKQLDAALAVNPEFAPLLDDRLKELEDGLAQAGKRLVSEGFLTRFIDTFKAASPDVKKAMEDNVITPAEEAALQATAVGKAFLEALPHTSEFFQSFGVNAKSAIEDAAAAIRNPAPIAAALRSNIEDATAAAKATAAASGSAHGKVIVDSIASAIRAGRQAVADAIKELPSAPAVLGRDIAVAQAQGNQGRELLLLQEQEKKRQAFLNDVLARPATAKNVELARKAAQNLEQTRAAIKSILDQRAAIAKQAADAATAASKTEADAAKKVKAAQNQTFLQTQEDARTRQERLISQAGDTPALTDDIRRQEQLRTLIKKQIVALKASAVDEQTKQDALRTLRKARDATTDEIRRLISANKKLNQEQKQDALDQITENLALRTQISEARDAGTSAIVKRIDAEIANQLKVVARAKKAKKGVLEAILQLETLRQKKRELLKTAEATAKDDQGFSGFEFLQKTQGFASNLLGNLIPGFATGGLVGNTSAVQGQITDPTLGAGIERTTGFGTTGNRGVRPVQVDTTNALLRQILAALGGRQTNPVEIRRNRFTSDAVLDTL